MTLFVGILDPNALQAIGFLEGSRKLVPILPWLVNTTTRFGRLSLSLDSAPQSPYSTFQDISGRAVFILGDILPKPATDNAVWLNEQYLQEGPEILARQNGYYLAGLIDEHETIYLAADQLGLMPLYYWAGPEHFCFSTSPNAFLSHPSFTAKPALMGIASILLTMHATGDHTIWQDVKRLPPGHLLRWKAHEGIRITDVNSLKVHDRYFGWPLKRCQELIQNSFNKAVMRHAGLGETSVLLSGGLDSRLVAGCLRWHARYKAPVITLGESTDYEMQCARQVAERLGWPMYPVQVNLNDYRTWAPVQARLEGMQTSFNEFMWWQALDTAHRLKPRIMNGLLGDPVMGGSLIARDIENENGQHTFAAQFERSNQYGFKAELISRLAGQPGLGEAVVEELKQTWAAFDGLPFQKCWLFDMQHRIRLHVGPVAWRLSFGAWPTIPYADSDLVHVMAGMAAPAFAERRAQIDMLKHKFPKLAVLPLDRNSSDTTPITPSLSWTMKCRVSRLFQALMKNKHTELRQYYRHFNVNGAGWQSVRQLSEKYRSASRLFDLKILDAILPPTDRPLYTPDPIIDGARYRALIGLLLQFGVTNTGDRM